MTEKTKDKIRKAKHWFGTHVNHNWFSWGINIFTVGMVYFLIKLGSVQGNAVIGLISGQIQSAAIFLGIAFGLQWFQMGIGRDITKEIYDENNIAAAIYQGFLLLGIATVIAKAIL